VRDRRGEGRSGAFGRTAAALRSV